MKRILMCLSLCCMLCGCISGPGYERSKESATINNTTWDEMMERIDNDETFMFMVTFEECPSCEYFIENVLTDYLDNHGFELNRVNFTEEIWFDKNELVKQFIVDNPYTQLELSNAKIYDYTEDDSKEGILLTPTLYFVENGEVKDKLIGGNISVEELDSLIVKYRLDEKR